MWLSHLVVITSFAIFSNLSQKISSYQMNNSTCTIQEKSFSDQVIDLVNEERIACGKKVLTASEALTYSAQDYAEIVARENWISHKGPDGSTPSVRA